MTIRLHINAVGAVMGGAARHLGPFVEAMVDARPAWHLTAYVSDASRSSLSGADVRLVRRAGARRIIWDAAEVSARARRAGADAILNLTNYGPIVTGVPSILYQRNPIYFDPSWLARSGPRMRVEAAARRSLAFREMRASAIVVVPSYAMASYLRSWSGCPDVPIRVVPHAVDPKRFSPDASRRPPRRDALALLSVSHAAPHKGQELLLDVLAELERLGISATLDLTVDRADSPATVDRLVDRARDRRVGDRVRLLGRVEDVEKLYRACDVMVFPSLTESFGFPLLEAAASGIPIVASGIASSIELLGDAASYFVPRDAGAAARAIAALIDEPESVRSALVERARLRAAAHTWRANAEQIAGIVEDLVAS